MSVLFTRYDGNAIAIAHDCTDELFARLVGQDLDGDSVLRVDFEHPPDMLACYNFPPDPDADICWAVHDQLDSLPIVHKSLDAAGKVHTLRMPVNSTLWKQSMKKFRMVGMLLTPEY
jgi:hypothetical protein